MKINERKYLDISTAHLRQNTFNNLSDINPPYTYKYDEGVFISVPIKSEMDNVDMPRDLRILLQYAWDNNIELIRMDRDANFDDDLPVYNWEDKEDEKLIERIWSCLSDGYDDEEYKEDTVNDLVAAIEYKDTGMLKVMLNRLCERIEDMEEE